MGMLKKELQATIRMAGSKAEARKQAMEWFNRSLEDFNNKAVVKRANRFMPGKIYVFRYDTPITEDRMPWWDRNPVVLALDPVDGNDCGINLNLLPVYVKETLLDDIHTIMNGQIKTAINRGAGNAAAQPSLRFTYKGAKAYLDRYGLGFAVRQYKPSLKKKQAIIAYERWIDIILCEFFEIEGASIGKVKAEFRKYYNNKNI